MTYKLYKAFPSDVVNAAMLLTEDRCVSFLFDPDNTDYQEYLKWIAEGNTPEPADE